MKTRPDSRRYFVPAVFSVAVVASYAFGYMTNLVFSDSATEQLAAAQLVAAQNANAAGGGNPADRAAANRVGGQFVDGGAATGSSTVGQVTAGEPLEAWLKKLMAQDDEAFRLRHFMQLFDVLNTPGDIQEALKALKEAGGGRGNGRMEVSLLLQKLTMLDPKAALAYAAESGGREHYLARATVLRTWAKTDPDAALAYAKTNGAPKEGEGRRPGGNENTMLASVVTEIARTNVDKAIAAASTGNVGGRTVDLLAGEMIEQRGANAARDAAAALPAGAFKNELIQQLTGKLAAKDPKGTAVWVSGLASGEAKSQALLQVVQEWTKKDATAAGTFISGLPVAADSDPARARFAAEIAGKDRNSALQTIRGISDPKQQMRTVGEIAGSMAKRDVAAGQQFVAQSSIQEQAKAEIARRLVQPRRGPGGRGGQNFGSQSGGGRGGR